MGIGNRRWVLLGGVRSGQAIGAVYHWVGRDAKATACGIKLPESFGRFWNDEPMERCVGCVDARRPPSKPKLPSTTELEFEVLKRLHDGLNPWGTSGSGAGSRIVSQAMERLVKKGLVTKPPFRRDVTDLGRAKLQEVAQLKAEIDAHLKALKEMER